MPEPLTDELAFARALVRECAALALRYHGRSAASLGLQHKPGGKGPVTAADRELNERIVAALRSRFPGDMVIAEESSAIDPAAVASRCWFVDPIDGTGEFVRGDQGWTVQVGLVVDGIPALGVVAEPTRRRLSWAVCATDGHRRSGQQDGDDEVHPLQPSARSLADLRLIGPSAPPLSRQRAVRRALGVPATRCLSVGSVGVRMTAIARGDADAYVQPPGRAMTWDTCAPAVLLHAVGGRVTDLRGHPLDYGTSSQLTYGVVASHGHEHETILKRVSPLATRWLLRD